VSTCLALTVPRSTAHFSRTATTAGACVFATLRLLPPTAADPPISRTRPRSPDNPTLDDTRSDEELMQHYAGGDTRAFELLYARHRRSLFGFLRRALDHPAHAEEAFQEVWSRIIQARARYRPDARFTTWMFQIAHNLLIDGHRRNRPTQGLDQLDEARIDPEILRPEQPERALSAFEERRRLQLAIAELPEEQRVALQLRLAEELPLEEIASITGVGRETVKSRLRYAMDRLRARLGEY
jgi:RNA polymerase sigma-70 factor, ECF subfamily